MADDRRKKLLTDRAEVYDGLGGDAAPEGKLVTKVVCPGCHHLVVKGGPHDMLACVNGAISERDRIEREFQRRRHAVTDPAVRAELEAFIDWLRGDA